MLEVYYWVAYVLIVGYSIITHEIAHGVAALMEGDDTAKIMGRITLNPIPHIDLFRTIIMPAVLILSGSPVVFGGAKPVPVNPLRFRHRIRSDIIVSSAGVISNLILAYLFIVMLHFASGKNIQLFGMAALVNVALAVFNLVPIPPLDGHHLFKYLLPKDMRRKYEDMAQYGMFLIFGFLIIGGNYLGYIMIAVASLLSFLGGHGWNLFYVW
jgi:Zn-dependent protease